MAFFSVPSQPVRINARAFLGLEPTAALQAAEETQESKVEDVAEKPPEKEGESKEVEKGEVPEPGKEAEGNRKRSGRREPAERAKRWRKRRKKRRVTGHVTGAAVAAEKHGALPVVAIEGASSDEDECRDEGVAAADRGEESKTAESPSSANVDDGDAAEEEKLPEKEDSSLASRDLPHGDENRQSEGTSGQGSPEETTTVTICDAVDDLSESGSDIVDELCMNDDDDNDDGENANEAEYLIDGRTINYDKLFSEESATREDFEADLCYEQQQQVVNNVVSSFREIGDAQPSDDVANLPLTQSEERLLMFGWKEGIEDDNGDDVAIVDEDGKAADQVASDSATLEGKVESAKQAADDPAQSSPSERKYSYQPQSKSPAERIVAPVPTERLAPRADVDSFSDDDDLEICVVVSPRSESPIEVPSGRMDTSVESEFPAAGVDAQPSHFDDNQNLDSSCKIDSLLSAGIEDSADISDIAVANASGEVCQLSSLDDGVANLAQESAQISMQSALQDLSKLSAKLPELTGTSTVPLHVEVEETAGVDEIETLEGAASTADTPSLSDNSRATKLDPVARIDQLLESLSSSRIGPISPSLLRSDNSVMTALDQQSRIPDVDTSFTRLQNSFSPSRRVDRSADASLASDHAAETSDVQDESHVVEFKVEDESGVERSFQVDESFISTRDKHQRQFSEKESLSDMSFSANDSAADNSIACRNADESSSSGTQEVMTCPAALMAATDDSLSLDRLASFSFDDILSTDSVLDGESESQGLADVEASSSESKDRQTSSKPVCNGVVHEDMDPVSKQVHATMADLAAGKESPPVAAISPSRLVDAKRRFFCEPPQPVRIDPRRVFDEIPATASKAVPQLASTRVPQQRVNGGPITVENVSSGVSSSEQPRRRVLPSVPTDQPQLDVSQVVLSPDEIALIKSNRQQSGEQAVYKSAQTPTAVDDASIVQRRPHRAEKKRPSSAMVVTAAERDKIDSSAPSSVLVRPSPHTASKPSAIVQRQSSYSDSTTDGSPSQRRERIWGFHRPKSSKTKPAAGESAGGGGDAENLVGKDKRRSLLALLMPSKSLERKDKPPKDLPPKDLAPVSQQKSAGDATAPETAPEASVNRAEIIATIREKTRSLPLEKKKLPPVPASDSTKRSSLEKQRSKSSKSRGGGGKKSEGADGDGRTKPTPRTVYEEMAPIIEGIKRVERRNREKVNIHDRIHAVAPPPAKAPFTALLPPKADSKCVVYIVMSCNFSMVPLIGATLPLVNSGAIKQPKTCLMSNCLCRGRFSVDSFVQIVRHSKWRQFALLVSFFLHFIHFDKT